MNPLDAVRHRLQEIATTAATAAEALDAGRCDFQGGELARYQGRLDVLALRLTDVCDRLAVGVDPQAARADAP
jgi:hypothetical protein